jgi:hypothetical protein
MTAAIVAVVYGIVLPVTLDRLAQKDVRAAGGAMDLSGWSFAERGIVRLDGEWEFYPNRLLVSGDFAASPELAREKETIRVPGSWETRMPAYGIATYRLRVYVPEPDGLFGLKTLSVQMASRIYVNGEEAAASGHPAGDASYEARNKPFAVYFPVRDGWNEIIVHAANFDFPASSGINHPIYFGPQKAIGELQSLALAHDWISVVSFGIVGLFYVGLFALRRKDPFLLAFGTLCICIAVCDDPRRADHLRSVRRGADLAVSAHPDGLDGMRRHGDGRVFAAGVSALQFRPRVPRHDDRRGRFSGGDCRFAGSGVPSVVFGRPYPLRVRSFSVRHVCVSLRRPAPAGRQRAAFAFRAGAELANFRPEHQRVFRRSGVHVSAA